MAAKKRRFRRKLGYALLNTIAVFAFLFPLFGVGYFVYGYANIEPRHVDNLGVIPESETPELYKEPLVSVTFDDGWQSVYTKAAPLLEKYGIRTTQYVITGAFSDRNYLSVEQARSLKNAGHEIGSHTVTHALLPTLSADELKRELSDSKEALIKHGLVSDYINFAAPESETDDAADAMIYDTYASHRNTYGDIQNGVTEDDVNVPSRPFNRFDIIGYSVNQDTTIDQIKEALLYAKKNNGWLILVYHQVDDSDDKYSTSPTKLREQLKLISASRIKTATMEQVLRNEEVNRS